MSKSHDLAHASMRALAADAPDALLGARERSRQYRVGGFSLDRFDWPTPRPETTEERARRDLIAAANDAPGAVIGSVGCCCPLDHEHDLIDFQRDCGKHGEAVRRFLYLMGVQSKRTTARLLRPRGLGRA